MSLSSISNLAQQGLNAAKSINAGGMVMKLIPSEQLVGQASSLGNTVVGWVKHPGELSRTILLNHNKYLQML